MLRGTGNAHGTIEIWNLLETYNVARCYNASGTLLSTPPREKDSQPCPTKHQVQWQKLTEVLLHV